MTQSNGMPTGHVDREKRRAVSAGVKDWKVLIVDDQRDNLSVAETALLYHGAEVRTARNGAEGLKILEQYDATLILLDLSMPVMSGWEMFIRLRATPKTAKIPVIALTAHAMHGDEGRVMAAGFNGYIPKPFSVTRLVFDIQDVLQASV